MVRRFSVWLVLVVLSFPRPAWSYPIPPQTLWSLAAQAELVVLADVEHLGEDAASEEEDGFSFDTGARARLRVREVWKGTAPRDGTLEVRFNPNLACPAPPVYEKGRVVVAFLAQEKGDWSTVGLSYGTRYPGDDGEVQALRRAVRDAVALQRQGATDARQRDWHVRAAAHPATRWDGLYGLVPDADERRAFYDPRERPKGTLTRAQQETLARGFIDAPPTDPSLPMMLAALRGHPSRAVDAAATSALEAVMQERPEEWTAVAMDLLRERLGSTPRPRPKRDPFEQTMRDAARGRGPDAAEERFSLREQWERLKHEHRLKPAVLPRTPRPEVRGTGGDTPL